MCATEATQPPYFWYYMAIFSHLELEHPIISCCCSQQVWQRTGGRYMQNVFIPSQWHVDFCWSRDICWCLVRMDFSGKFHVQTCSVCALKTLELLYIHNYVPRIISCRQPEMPDIRILARMVISPRVQALRVVVPIHQLCVFLQSHSFERPADE